MRLHREPVREAAQARRASIGLSSFGKTNKKAFAFNPNRQTSGVSTRQPESQGVIPRRLRG